MSKAPTDSASWEKRIGAFWYLRVCTPLELGTRSYLRGQSVVDDLLESRVRDRQQKE